MSRLALCLFIVAIIHNGILKLAHADEVTTEAISKIDADEEVTKEPIVVPEVKSGQSSKAEPKVKADDTHIEEKDDKVIKINKDGDTETVADTPIKDVKVIKANREGNTPDQFFDIKHTQVFLETPKKVLGSAASLPSNAQNSFGGHIGAAMGNTMNTFKNLASAPFGFLRNAVNTAFESVQ